MIHSGVFQYSYFSSLVGGDECFGGGVVVVLLYCCSCVFVVVVVWFSSSFWVIRAHMVTHERAHACMHACMRVRWPPCWKPSTFRRDPVLPKPEGRPKAPTVYGFFCLFGFTAGGAGWLAGYDTMLPKNSNTKRGRGFIAFEFSPSTKAASVACSMIRSYSGWVGGCGAVGGGGGGGAVRSFSLDCSLCSCVANKKQQSAKGGSYCY